MSRTSADRNSSTNSGTERVECPIVKNACGISPALSTLSGGGELPTKRLHLLEPLRHVAHERRHADPAAALVLERHDRELDRDAPAVLADGRHREKIPVAVPAPAGLDDPPPAFPVSGAQTLGDDQVERLPDCLAGAVSENPLRTGVPEADDPRSIGRNHRIGGSGDDAVGREAR